MLRRDLLRSAASPLVYPALLYGKPPNEILGDCNVSFDTGFTKGELRELAYCAVKLRAAIGDGIRAYGFEIGKMQPDPQIARQHAGETGIEAYGYRDLGETSVKPPHRIELAPKDLMERATPLPDPFPRTGLHELAHALAFKRGFGYRLTPEIVGDQPVKMEDVDQRFLDRFLGLWENARSGCTAGGKEGGEDSCPGLLRFPIHEGDSHDAFGRLAMYILYGDNFQKHTPLFNGFVVAVKSYFEELRSGKMMMARR